MTGAVQDLTIDEPMRGALTRLTGNEKECLRRRLLHQTAKEMALELGISPHAVEKRLKMARTKLGLSSSLEAARLLADFERYQHAGPHSPDLASELPQRQKRPTKPLIVGGIAMSIAAAALIFIATQAPSANGGAPAPGMRKASWDETASFLTDGFKIFDKDRSGFLDPAESSALEPREADHRDKTLPPAPPASQPDPAAEAKWMAKLDENRDGQVSVGEYVGYMMPWALLNGIPKDWKRPSPYAELEKTGPGTSVAIATGDLQFAPASPERIRKYLGEQFAHMDRNKSGFIEAAEAYDQEHPGRPQSATAAVNSAPSAGQIEWISFSDTNRDGKTSKAEYVAWLFPNYEKRGIPLIPADWKQNP